MKMTWLSRAMRPPAASFEGVKVMGSFGGVDEGAEDASSGGFAAAGGSGDLEDGVVAWGVVGGGRTESGEEPDDEAEPGVTVVLETQKIAEGFEGGEGVGRSVAKGLDFGERGGGSGEEGAEAIGASVPAVGGDLDVTAGGPGGVEVDVAGLVAEAKGGGDVEAEALGFGVEGTEGGTEVGFAPGMAVGFHVLADGEGADGGVGEGEGLGGSYAKVGRGALVFSPVIVTVIGKPLPGSVALRYRNRLRNTWLPALLSVDVSCCCITVRTSCVTRPPQLMKSVNGFCHGPYSPPTMLCA
jgi:hypothetical protein